MRPFHPLVATSEAAPQVASKAVTVASLLVAVALAGLPTSTHAQSVRVETLSEPLEGGSGGLSVAPDGKIYVADFGEMLNGSGAPGTRVYVVEPDGASRVFADGFFGASGNELGPDGVLYQSNIAGGFISKVYPDGRNERWVSDGIANPVGLVLDRAGDLIVANCGNSTLQRVKPDGTSTQFVASSLLACPNGITIGDDGTFFVANFMNGNVVRVSAAGEASVLATLPGNNNGHLVFHDGRLYVVARSAHQIYTVTLDGEVSLLAGSGAQGLDDGPAADATFSYPNDIGVSPDGRYLYVNDVAELTSRGVLLAPMVVRRIHIGG